MNIYLAGAPGGGSTGLCKRERELNRLWKLRLWSYYHLTLINGTMPEIKSKKVELFLDSGAFSAWSQGKIIDIYEYIDFIKEHKKVIDVYANLDVIGNAEATWKNQMIMEKAGLNPLPVFHFGEDIKWLIKILKRDYEYISLGGMVPISTTNLYHWLDDLFTNYLTDKHGIPIVKVHGFGLTSLRLMLRYPWYCMTEEDHTVLTKSGWKGLSKLFIGEEILCFNNGISEWQPIIEIPIFEVENEQINHLWNRNFDCYVTDNHRWKITNQNTKDEKWIFRNTQDLKIGDCINRIGKPGYNVFLKDPIFSDTQIGLLAWFWTDGTIKKRVKYKNDSIVIYQSERANPEKCEIIRNLLISSKEKSWISKPDKQGMIQFELYGSICKWLLSFAPKKVLPKTLPYQLTKKQAEIFINYSILADGTISGLKRIVGFEITVSRQMKKDNLEIMRIICQLLGIPTSIFEGDGIHKGLLSSSVNHVYYNQLNKEKITYSGRLWCVQVPSAAFFTKCNNHIYVTGNSVDSTSWVLTGRMGAIFVPRFRGGNWIYNDDPWKVNVSNKSPDQKEAGKHITTMSPLEKQILLNYIQEKGYKLGKSEFKMFDQNYELKENEKWSEKKPTDKKAKREVEIIIEAGVSNRYQFRDEMNIIYFLDLEKSMPKWPWAFKKKEVPEKGFFD